MEPLVSAGVSIIKAFHVLWVERRDGWGGGFSRYTELVVYPFSYQSGAQMANNYFLVCA